MEPKYSVLMSVYYKENPEFLRTSIDSMINQTLAPDEIVIVKDGQLTQNLEEVINGYILKKSHLFKIVSLPENRGLGIALDAGLKHCSNELVARMDSDDISLEERCEKQIKAFMENPELSIVGSMIDEFYDKPTNIVSSRVVPTEHRDIVNFIKRRSPFNHPAVMYKKNEVIRCGGYGNLRRKQDLDLFSRMINNGCKSTNINESLLLFRSNEKNFKRRKSWINCKSYIDVEYAIWRRGHCSLWDFLIVVLSQIIMWISPMWLLKWLSNTFLRKTHKERGKNIRYYGKI